MAAILTAFRFLTILPLGRGREAGPKDMAAAMAWFPLVGLCLGLGLDLIDHGMQRVLPQGVADVFIIALLAFVTGGFHLDGFADTLDGLYGGRGDRERTLAIMKDSHVGAMGLIGLVLLMLLKFETLENVAWTARAGALIVMPMAARWAQVLMAFGAGYARKEGSLAQPFVENLEMPQFLIATATAAIGTVVFAGPRALVILAVCGAFALLAKYYFGRKIGGVTGDTIGGVSETVEVMSLLGFLLAF